MKYLAAALLLCGARAQLGSSATLQGSVRDSKGVAVAGASIQIQVAGSAAQTVRSDARGGYRFSALAAGAYTLRAQMTALGEATIGPFPLTKDEDKHVDLVLKLSVSSMEFFDEPKFTVAGVTENSYGGGHGSDTVVRSAEALTKATASLSQSKTGNNDAAHSLLAAGKYNDALAYLQKASQANPRDAELHHLMGFADEALADPLNAVSEYQKAAELEPSETNLFDWGTELLTHGAPEPAAEVFQQGARLFPRSSRMWLGSAVALYAKGDYREAAKRFFEATDVDPADAGPYLFMGRVQSPDITADPEFLNRMARFVQLQPENAWANYYYASSLLRVRKEAGDKATIAQARLLLEKAVRLEPTLAVAYLQLGILCLENQELPQATRALEKAVEQGPSLELAHYRLAAAYRQTGEFQKARAEIDLFQKLSKTSAQAIARERSQLQQFVIALKKPDH